jgi:hypothetical protein
VRDRLAAKVDPRIKAAYGDLVHMAKWRRAPAARVTRRFARHYGLTVRSGPFAGMRYPDLAVGRVELLTQKLLGAYERELHDAFESVIAQGFETVVDIGSSDGYYAVGLARRMPEARVHAWEANPLPQRVSRAVARENGVEDRIDFRGLADAAALRDLPEERAFVLSDCEGCERELIDPDAVPLLRTSTILVELHPFAAPGIEATIAERFRDTHRIETISGRPRYVGDFPELVDLPGASYMDRELAVTEYRVHPMDWALLTPA